MLFDRYVVVDWSASSTPTRGADSIWVAVIDDAEASSVNLPTRASTVAFLDELVHDSGERRTLLGVDASLGYPAGTAAALGLVGRPWAAMWSLLAEEILDDDRNVNRFTVAAELNRRMGSPPGPFWGCPPSAAAPALTATKPPPSRLDEWRRAEVSLRAGGQRPGHYSKGVVR